MSTPDRFNRYDLQDLVRLSATFLSLASAPADPSTVMFLVRSPLGSVATYAFGTASVTRAGVGAYYVEVIPSVAGTWFYRAHGTGGVLENEEWGFIADQSFIL